MDISDMVGMVFTSVTHSDDEELIFKSDSHIFKFYHQQSGCESVYIESIVGDLDDLVGTPILFAEEVSSEYMEPLHEWTFYKFATNKGYVDVRWYGSSNGYYSTSVDLEIQKISK